MRSKILWLNFLLLLTFIIPAWSYNFDNGYDKGKLRAADITTDTSAFTLNLSSVDIDVQHALNTLDQLIVNSGSGNVGIGTPTRIPEYIGPTTIGSPYNNVMDSNGNIGIGTTFPPNKLYVAGTTETQAFKLPLNPVAGYILTSDSVGVGTWMPAPVSSPGVSSQWFTQTQTSDLVGIGTYDKVGIGTTRGTGAGLVIMNGNVGIGTWKPRELLRVGDGTGTNSGSTTMMVTKNGFTALEIKDSSANLSGTLETNSSPVALFINGHSGNIGIGAAGNVSMYVTNNNVGIGGNFTSPVALLDVTSSANQDLFRVDDAGGSDTTPFIIDRNGNVGIGTSVNPNKLYVAGTAEVQAFKMNASPINGYVLTSDSSGVGSWAAAGSSSQWITNPGVGIGTTVGTVGIGTVASSAKLAIVGNVGIGTVVGDPYVMTTPPSGGIITYGNIGIGTINSTNTLNVFGTPNTSGIDITAAGTSSGMGINANTILNTHFNLNYTDNSTSPLSCTNTNGTIDNTNYKFGGGSLSLNGTNAYVSCGAVTDFKFLHNGVGTWEINLWYKAPDFSNQYYLIATAPLAGGNTGINFSINTDRTFWLFIGNTTGTHTFNTASFASFPNDTTNFHLITLTYDESLGSNNAKIYIDGVLSGQGTKAAGTPASGNSITAFEVGKDGSNANYGKGNVDEVNVSNIIIHSGNFTVPSSENSIAISQPQITFNNSTSKLWTIGSDGNDSNKFKFSTTSITVNTRMIIDSNGNLGIGTNNPFNILSVGGNAAIGAAYSTVVAPTNGLIVQGNVGIGTITPGQILDVQGTVRVSKLGSTLAVASGTNGCVGQATLSSGVVTVTTTCTPSSSAGIFLTDAQSSILNVGSVTIATVSAGSSFVIQSTNVADSSNVNWFITKTN